MESDPYETAVLNALKEGPMTRHDLVRELCDQDKPEYMSIKKLQKTLNELEDDGEIVCRPARIGTSHKWTSVYSLPRDRHLIEKIGRAPAVGYARTGRKPTTLTGKIRLAIEELEFKFFRKPKLDEIACEVGASPEDVRKSAYRLAPETGWRPPTSGEIQDAFERAAECLKLAAMIRQDPNNHRVKQAPDEEIKIARKYLTRYPELVPEIKPAVSTHDYYIGETYVWPKEARPIIGHEEFNRISYSWVGHSVARGRRVF